MLIISRCCVPREGEVKKLRPERTRLVRLFATSEEDWSMSRRTRHITDDPAAVFYIEDDPSTPPVCAVRARDP